MGKRRKKASSRLYLFPQILSEALPPAENSAVFVYEPAGLCAHPAVTELVHILPALGMLVRYFLPAPCGEVLPAQLYCDAPLSCDVKEPRAEA